MTKLQILQREVIACTLCPRLVEYRHMISQVKRRAYRDWTYWGRPVPGFGDPKARLLLIGLAPGAHGANRTGRIFTGDSSGDFLYRALFETGFASQPESRSIDDGLQLRDAYISCAVRCAPPDNKPTPGEVQLCSSQYLERELALLRKVEVVVALGRLAFDTYLRIQAEAGRIGRRSGFLFGHDEEHPLGWGLPILISSYHPSQQNTSTGRLTAPMFRQVFERARALLAATKPAAGQEGG